MTSYKILLLAHIASAVLAIGSTVAYPFVQAAAERQGVAGARFFLAFGRRISRAFQYPGYAILVLAGIGLIFDDATGYKDDLPGWLLIAAGLTLAILSFEFFLAAPVVKRATEVLARADASKPLPKTYIEMSKLMGVIGLTQSVLAVVVLFLMVWKPGA